MSEVHNCVESYVKIDVISLGIFSTFEFDIKHLSLFAEQFLQQEKNTRTVYPKSTIARGIRFCNKRERQHTKKQIDKCYKTITLIVKDFHAFVGNNRIDYGQELFLLFFFSVILFFFCDFIHINVLI